MASSSAALSSRVTSSPVVPRRIHNLEDPSDSHSAEKLHAVRAPLLEPKVAFPLVRSAQPREVLGHFWFRNVLADGEPWGHSSCTSRFLVGKIALRACCGVAASPIAHATMPSGRHVWFVRNQGLRANCRGTRLHQRGAGGRVRAEVNYLHPCREVVIFMRSRHSYGEKPSTLLFSAARKCTLIYHRRPQKPVGSQLNTKRRWALGRPAE